MAAGAADPFVVRCGLLAGVLREVDPGDARVGEGGDDRLGIVGAVIADDDQLPVRDGGLPHAGDGVRENVAAVVGRHDDRDQRRLRHWQVAGRRPARQAYNPRMNVRVLPCR
jgi:hypothetical protein